MADFNFKPVASQIQPTPQMSLGDMMNLARGAQQYQQAEQINPLLLQQQQQLVEQARQVNPLLLKQAEETTTQSQTKTKEDLLAFANKKMNLIANSQISMINDPLILKAEQQPSSVNPQELIKLINERGLKLAKDLGISQEEAQGLLQPYVDIAQNNPGELRNYYKQRHILALDQAGKTAALSETGVPIATGGGGYTVSTGEFGATPKGEVLPGTAYSRQLGPENLIKVSNEIDPKTNLPIAYKMSPDGTFVERVVVDKGTPAGTYPENAVKKFTPPGMIRPEQQQQVGPRLTTAPGVIPVGENQAMGDKYRADIAIARDSAIPANIALNNIDTVLKYLPYATVGTGSQYITGLESVFGTLTGSTSAEKAASAANIIQKNIVDLGILKNEAFKGKFAASLDASLQSLADVSKNPSALKSSMEQLRPLMQHIRNYTTGLDNAVTKSPDNVYVKPKFDKEMNEAFDVKAMQMKNAADAGEFSKFVKDNKIDLRQQQELYKKLLKYQSLVNGNL